MKQWILSTVYGVGDKMVEECIGTRFEEQWNMVLQGLGTESTCWVEFEFILFIVEVSHV